MTNANRLFQALADPTRREILRLLRKQDLTPGDLFPRFNISKPSLSHHLDILKQADLVLAERNGQRIVYSLNMTVLDEVLAMMASTFGKKSASQRRKHDQA